MSMKRLSSSLRAPLPANEELIAPYISGERPLGQQSGGVSMFSNEFKRGHGEDVFGSNSKGIWLGGADWENGRFRVDMEGNVTAISANLTGYPSNDEALLKDGSNQDLNGEINVGSGSGIKIDGPNEAIIFRNKDDGKVGIFIGEI